VRAKSKALFGNRDRLEVAVAIAKSEDGVVNATDLSFELGMVNSRVRAQLLAFAEVGLLVLGTTPAENGKRWYVRQQSSFWATCIEMTSTWIR
jgi:hypothetical protein